MRRLGKFITAERLAVAIFLIVACGLWWRMQSLPELVITFHSDKGETEGELSPDGTLYLVTEIRASRRGGPAIVNDGEYQKNRLRVFDLTTGQEIWRWERGKTEIWKV